VRRAHPSKLSVSRAARVDGAQAAPATRLPPAHEPYNPKEPYDPVQHPRPSKEIASRRLGSWNRRASTCWPRSLSARSSQTKSSQGGRELDAATVDPQRMTHTADDLPTGWTELELCSRESRARTPSEPTIVVPELGADHADLGDDLPPAPPPRTSPGEVVVRSSPIGVASGTELSLRPSGAASAAPVASPEIPPRLDCRPKIA